MSVQLLPSSAWKSTFLVLLALAHSALLAEDVKVALVVANRAGDVLIEKIEAFEDFVSADLTEAGLEVISREVVFESLASLTPESQGPKTLERTVTETTEVAAGTQQDQAQVVATASGVSGSQLTQGTAAQSSQQYAGTGGAVVSNKKGGTVVYGSAAGAQAASSSSGTQLTQASMMDASTASMSVGQGSASSVVAGRSTRTITELPPEEKADTLDDIFARSTSALRLSQSLGADYLFYCTLSSLGEDSRTVNAYGNNFVTNTTTLRVSYRLLDGQTGASIVASTAEASESVRNTAFAQSGSTDVLNRLLREASADLASKVKTQLDRKQITPSEKHSMVNFTVTATVDQLSVPEVVVMPDGQAVVTDRTLRLEPTGAIVELDGIAIGSAGQDTTFVGAPGIHRIRVAREGFEPFERMVNIYEGLALSVSLTLSEEGYARWKDQSAFLNDLKAGSTLSAAEAERLRGEAQMLRQSGVRINVDTDEAMNIENKYQSLFD